MTKCTVTAAKACCTDAGLSDTAGSGLLSLLLIYAPQLIAALPTIIADIQAAGGKVTLSTVLKVIEDIVAGIKPAPATA